MTQAQALDLAGLDIWLSIKKTGRPDYYSFQGYV